MSFWKFLLHLVFFEELSRFGSELLVFQQFNNFRTFRKLSEEISETFVPVMKVPGFWLSESAHSLNYYLVDKVIKIWICRDNNYIAKSWHPKQTEPLLFLAKILCNFRPFILPFST